MKVDKEKSQQLIENKVQKSMARSQARRNITAARGNSAKGVGGCIRVFEGFSLGGHNNNNKSYF